MTSPPQLVSPIKHTSAIHRTGRASPAPARRTLFAKPVEDSEDSETLSKLYRHNLDVPGVLCSSKEFFETRDAVEAIEKFLLSSCGLINRDTIRVRIGLILKLGKHEEKITELGMVLFYLDRDLQLPDTDSFLTYRAEEINREVADCLQQHQAACANPLIPSGKTHYLMRAFAHMALTSGQIYNKGGILAINELLNNPAYKIALHFQPEHRQHILAVIEELMTNKAFKSLMEKQTTIHPDLENLIRLDLKLSPDHPVSSAYIVYDVLMSLFVDIRQKENPNCYAVAALIYTIENETFIFFEKTLDWLKHGYASLGNRFTLPIQPLVEKRLHYISDLKCKMGFEDTIGLAPFQHMSGAFGIDSNPAPDSGQPITISHTLSKLLKDINASEHLPYAERMYIAYKSNTLILLHLAVCELTYMNISDRGLPGLQTPSKFKRKFIGICLRAIENASSSSRPYPTEFMRALKVRLIEVLWLENCNEQQVSVQSSNIEVHARKIVHFTGDSFQLASVFRNSLRLFAFDGHSYEMIDKITDLQKVLVCASSDTAKALKISHKRTYIVTHLSIKEAVSKHRFRVEVTNYCSNQINKRRIRGVHLNKANLLLLKQEGGIPDEVLRLVYDISVKMVVVSGNATPYQFMRNLLEKIPTLDSNAFTSARKILLFTPGHHIWTLNPYSWHFLIENQHSFQTFIHDTVFSKVKRKLGRPIPQQTIDRVIEESTCNNARRQALQEEFQAGPRMTYQRFAENFLNSTLVPDSHSAREIIESAFAEIWLTKQSLSRTLNLLKIHLTTTQYHQILNSLPSDGTKPYILARFLRQQLIEHGIAIRHPYDIEHALCLAHNEPLSFPVGDSNWLHQNTEDPFHVELCIGYHYEKNTLVFRMRYKNHEEIESNSQYNTVEIQHPSS